MHNNSHSPPENFYMNQKNEDPQGQQRETNSGSYRGAQDEMAADSLNGSAQDDVGENASPGFFQALEQDIMLISTSFDAMMKWCVNTSSIAAIEAKTAIHALPRFLLARFAFVILQLFSWALILLSVSYAVYLASGSMVLALAAAISLQFIVSFIFYIYIQRLKQNLHFSKTRAELHALRQYASEDSGES